MFVGFVLFSLKRYLAFQQRAGHDCKYQLKYEQNNSPLDFTEVPSLVLKFTGGKIIITGKWRVTFSSVTCMVSCTSAKRHKRPLFGSSEKGTPGG